MLEWPLDVPTRQVSPLLIVRYFGSTLEDPKSKTYGLPQFDLDRFFDQLKVHHANSGEQQTKKNNWRELLRVDLETKPPDLGILPEASTSTMSAMPSASLEGGSEKCLVSNEEEVHPMKDCFSTVVASLEVDELVQRIGDLMVRTNDYHSALWGRTVSDLIK